MPKEKKESTMKQNEMLNVTPSFSICILVVDDENNLMFDFQLVQMVTCNTETSTHVSLEIQNIWCLPKHHKQPQTTTNDSNMQCIWGNDLVYALETLFIHLWIQECSILCIHQLFQVISWERHLTSLQSLTSRWKWVPTMATCNCGYVHPSQIMIWIRLS